MERWDGSAPDEIVLRLTWRSGRGSEWREENTLISDVLRS